MWNLLNRKWVPICSLVLSTYMLISSVYLYVFEHTHNMIHISISPYIFNIICLICSVLSLIIFVISSNILLIRRFMNNNSLFRKESDGFITTASIAKQRAFNSLLCNSSNGDSDEVQTQFFNNPFKDMTLNYSYINDLIVFQKDDNCLPMSLDALKQLIILNGYIHHDDSFLLDDCINAIRHNKNSFSYEFRVKYKSNDYNKYTLTSQVVYNDNHEPSDLSLTLQPTETNSYTASNNIHNQRDSLTSLYNFSTFKQVISNILSNTMPSNNLIHALLIIDIDDFHVFNERYGTEFSDTILISFSNQLSRILNERDLISYIHDNKFVVFLNSISYKDYIKDISKCISNMFLCINLGQNEPKLTCSIGISTISNRSISFDEALKEADVALYTAKITGKSKIIYYEDNLLSNTINYNSNYLLEKAKPLYDLPLVDNTRIIYNIINLFKDSSNLEISFNLALTLIGSVYDLDFLSIYELDNDNCLNTTFSWCSDLFLKHTTGIEHIGKSDYENFLLFKNSPNDIFYTDDFSNLKLSASPFKYALLDSNTSCVYQNKISISGEFQGFILASSTKQHNNWNTDISNNLTILLAIISNNLEKLRTQQRIQHMIRIDNLTGANNLKTFSNIISSLFENNPSKQYVLIYFDVDRFTIINENHGYTVGDYILKEITNILQSTLNEYESFCRIVDDKFVVLAEYISFENIKNRMASFSNAVYNICDNDSTPYKINLSAGLSMISASDNISQCIDEANIARRSIKNKHHSNYAFFNDSMRSQQIKQKSVEDVMEDALKNDEFCLFLQPKYNVEEQRICGAEALVRWNRPGYGLVPPDEFIPIFEENAFIIEIDYYIFDKVCELIRSLLDEGKTPVPISVNFSRLHLNNTRILTKLKDNLKKYNLTPEYIEIEITESALADSDVYMHSVLNEIHRLGFKLAMDDFGTGMSSLNSLRKLPFDILKLDKDFFQKDKITTRERIVISNIARLGKELAMTIVSEGIETAEQIAFLKDIHCPIIQGYFFSKPIHYNEFLSKYFS